MNHFAKISNNFLSYIKKSEFTSGYTEGEEGYEGDAYVQELIFTLKI